MYELSLTRFTVCTKCGCTKPATLGFFPAEKRNRSGLRNQCRACQSVYNRNYFPKWYANGGREIHSAAHRLWVEANPESIRVFHKRYDQSEKGRQRAKRQAQSEKRREWTAKWRKGRPPTENDRSRRRRYTARKRGAAGSHTAEEIIQMYEDQDGICAYCECSLDSTYHVDHMIPLSRAGGNAWDNLAVTCAACNMSKGNQTTEEFWALLSS